MKIDYIQLFFTSIIKICRCCLSRENFGKMDKISTEKENSSCVVCDYLTSGDISLKDLVLRDGGHLSSSSSDRCRSCSSSKLQNTCCDGCCQNTKETIKRRSCCLGVHEVKISFECREPRDAIKSFSKKCHHRH